MPFWLSFIGVFVALILVDICWTFYIAKVAERKAFSSAMWSAWILVCGAFATISYLHDVRLLVAAVLGAFVGTFIAVKWLNR